MAERKPAKKGTQKAAKSTTVTGKRLDGFDPTRDVPLPPLRTDLIWLWPVAALAVVAWAFLH